MSYLKSGVQGAVLISAVLSLGGCGGAGEKVELGQVSGVITLDGTPLSAATVIFSPEKGRPSRSKTGEDGRYDLQYTGDQKGALPGKHQVMITTETEGDSGEFGGQVVKPQKEILPARYHKATTLTAVIKQGNNTIDFDLKSK
tara:strand:+ start:3014 stop:3442 length:429 start_codon:yes stop_codon:yes gene_type:complete